MFPFGILLNYMLDSGDYVPLKRRLTFTGLHSVITQKITPSWLQQTRRDIFSLLFYCR
jgi:hypothetical protein